jgi:hypothetical protein
VNITQRAENKKEVKPFTVEGMRYPSVNILICLAICFWYHIILTSLASRVKVDFVLWLPAVHRGPCQISTLTSDDFFLPNPFEFIIDELSPHSNIFLYVCGNIIN